MAGITASPISNYKVITTLPMDLLGCGAELVFATKIGSAASEKAFQTRRTQR
jgi:hypothetical protein